MNPVKSGNRAITVQTKGQPLAIVAAVTQAPKVMMPTEISSETTLSMLGCSSRLCRPPSGKIAQPGERNGTPVKNRIENATMRTLAVIFVLGLITIAFEIYLDAALTNAEISHTAAPIPRRR